MQNLFKKYVNINIRKSLLGIIVAFSVIVMSCSLHATEVLNPEDFSRFNIQTYNALPEVKEADAILRSNGNLNAFLQDVRELLTQNPSSITTSLGFRLAHRHNQLDEGMAMVEEVDQIDNKIAFITSANAQENTGHYPASWVMTSSGLEVFEYAKDESVQQDLQTLITQQNIIHSIQCLSAQYDLNNILALSLLRRGSILELKENEVRLERTQYHPFFANIVMAEDLKQLEDRGANALQTSWGLVADSSKVHWCWAYTYCIQRDESDGGHLTVDTHQWMDD